MSERSYKTVVRVKEPVSKGTPVEHVPLPELGHKLIPKERYTSEEFLELEWQTIWTKVWLLGGLERDVAEPGDYLCTEIGRESVIIVRGQDNKLRAFYNVCPHRGNRLVEPGMDQVDSFVCSYHGWEYGTNGRFVSIPDRELFPQGPPCAGLTEIPCDTWNNFVFFSLNPDVMSLAEYMAPIAGHFEPYHFDRMTVVRDLTVEWGCNWKTSVDAFNETYHVAATHPQLLWYLNDMDVQIDCYERHSRYLVPFGMVSPKIERVPEIPPPLKVMLSDAGLDPASYEGPIDGIRKAVQQHLREKAAEEGFDYSDLNDDQLTDDYNYLVFPNLTFNTHADHLMLFRHRPHATDPNQMYFDVWMLHYIVDEDELPEERPRHRHFTAADRKSLGMVIDQDGGNLPKVQQGMNSAAFQGLWLGDLEVRLRHFHKTIEDYIQEYGPEDALNE
ncbi:MAG: aromatic ring-hydroxylating dioxygenase subunit alpha [Xanthomonadales bacterium]|nr:aromatic ring-hydroxylating dioxygenase subunit alpha [Xanthomonadales bacterium]